MSTIDRFMPQFALREVDHLAVATDAAETWRAVRAVDLMSLGFARQLFGLRAIPDRIAAWVRGDQPPPPPTGTIDQIGASSGFKVLADEPPHAVVVGSVGRFWKPAIEFAPISAERFAAFEEPGWGKLAWSLEVEPRLGGGSFVTIDLRVGATDQASLARFHQYWRLIGRFSRAIRHGFLRRFAAQLGRAPDAETPMPGDELLHHARFQRTQAVDIDAPPARVWPWLLQIGGRREGWRRIPTTPGSDGFFAVLREDAERVLVLGSPELLPGRPPDGTPPYLATWTFSLEPIGRDATHLTLRERGDYPPSLGMTLYQPLLATAHQLMEFRQLRTVKERAEST